MKRFDETLLIAVAVIFGVWIVHSGVENVQRPDFLDQPPTFAVKIQKSSPQAKLARFTKSSIVCWDYNTLLKVSKAVRQNDRDTLNRLERTGRIFAVREGTFAELPPPLLLNNNFDICFVYIRNGIHSGDKGITLLSSLELLE